jgi:hypothetical protein
MNEERTGVIWYFDPLYGKLNPHGILTPLISNQGSNQINTTSTTGGAGIAYLSRAPESSPGF